MPKDHKARKRPSWALNPALVHTTTQALSNASIKSAPYLTAGSGVFYLSTSACSFLGRLLSPVIVRSQEPVTLSALSQERLWTTVVSPEIDKHAGRAPVSDMGAAELG